MKCEYTFSDWSEDGSYGPQRCLTTALFEAKDKWGDKLQLCPFHYRYLTEGYARARRPYLIDKHKQKWYAGSNFRLILNK